MEINFVKLTLSKRTILNLKEFMKKNNLKDDSLNESELKRVYPSFIYLRDSNLATDKGFAFADIGRTGATHWTCFHIKNQIKIF